MSVQNIYKRFLIGPQRRVKLNSCLTIEIAHRLKLKILKSQNNKIKSKIDLFYHSVILNLLTILQLVINC